MKHSLARLLGFSVFATLSFASHPKISKEIDSLDPASVVNVIVQFANTPTAAQHKKVSDRGGVYRSTLSLVKAGSYKIPVSSLNSLATDPEVVHISPDHKLRGTLDNTTAAVNAAAAWSSGLTGKGIGVAIIDSGITPTGDLPASSIVFSQSYVGNDSRDYYGHGTHVAGIIAGNGAASHCSHCTRNLQGLATGVSLINIRVLDQNGEGSDSTVIAAINQVISLKATYNIRVLNLSLGRPVYESYTQDPLCQAVEAAWKAGIAVVVAAGNDGRDNSVGNNGYGTIMAPGNDPYVMTVGAVNTVGTYSRADDKMTSYSSKGPTAIDNVVKPDLVAPGNKVVSLYSSSGSLYSSYPSNVISQSYFTANNGNGHRNLYFMLSGTSMATPVVSGAAALLLQAHPSLTPDQIKARLMLTAYKGLPSTSTATDPVTGQVFTAQSDPFTVGAGYLDIAAALADNTNFVGLANSPTAAYDFTANTTSLVCGVSAICGSANDANSVWGVTTVWGLNTVLSLRTVWGLNTIWDLRSAWGANTVWGVRSVWGVNTVWGNTATTGDSAEGASITINGEN